MYAKSPTAHYFRRLQIIYVVVPTGQTVLGQFGLDRSPSTRDVNKEAATLLSRWLLRERIPFSIVDSSDFKAFLRRLNPHFQLPCRQTVKKKVMLESVEEREMVKQFFRDRPDLRPCCILDVWKSAAGDHYVGIVVSFIDTDWQMWAVTIAVKPIRVSHTSENVKVLVTEVMNDYHIIPQCFVADNAANQVRANDLLAVWSNEAAAAMVAENHADGPSDDDDSDLKDVYPDGDILDKVLAKRQFVD